jgi:hypothetical protein
MTQPGPNSSVKAGGALKKRVGEAATRFAKSGRGSGYRAPGKVLPEHLFSPESERALQSGDLRSFVLLTVGTQQRLYALAEHLESLGVPVLFNEDQYSRHLLYVPERCHKTATKAQRQLGRY